MKVLLVQPRKPVHSFGGEDLSMFEPLALEYLAGAVKDQHEVRVLDLRIEDRLDEVLQEMQPDVVGLTGYTVHVNTVNRLCEHIKAVDPRIVTVVGGHHATVHHEDFLTPHVDLIIMGEGSIPFRQALERIVAGRGFDGVPGAVYQEGGEVVINDAVSFDMDAIPPPDRSTTARYRKHYGCEWMYPIASVRTSKGCPFNCSYCALWTLTSRRYHVRSPEAIVEELKQIEEPCVFFADDESFIQIDRMMELARQIEAAGIQKRYHLYVRADTVVRNPEVIERWKAIGLERCFVGVEFFRDEDLESVSKGSSADKNLEAIRIIRELGVNLIPGFIVRQDFEEQDFRDLSQFCRDQRFDYSAFAVLTPLPGTRLHMELADQMFLRNYDYYDFMHTLLPTKLPIEEFYRQYLWLFDSTHPLGTQLKMLSKFPLTRLPYVFKTYARFRRAFKRIPRDYDNLEALNAAQERPGGMPSRKPLLHLRVERDGAAPRGGPGPTGWAREPAPRKLAVSRGAGRQDATN